MCKCASVSGTAVQLLCKAMCCWEMQSVTDSSYRGTVIVCTLATAVLNWGLGVRNISVNMALGKLLETDFWVLRGYILHVTLFLFWGNVLLLRNLSCLFWP
jgi:hypothetical protein